MSLQDKYPAYGGHGPKDLRLGISLAVIATIFMIMRVYVRIKVNKFGTTALLLSLLAWLLTAITQTLGIISVLHGLGNHITIIAQVGELHNFLLFTWITVFFFNLAIPTGKVAVAAFLIEMNGPSSEIFQTLSNHPEINVLIYPSSDPKIRRSLIAVAVVNIVLNIPQALLVWFQCTPVDAIWDPQRQDMCDHRISVYYTYVVGAVAALSDFYLAIVPIHMLIPLRIDRKLKWGLSFLMGCGVFAGVAAIIRTWAAKFILDADSSYGVGTLFLWGEVEEWLVLITMSIPPVWPLFRPFTSKFIKSTSSRGQPPAYAYGYNYKRTGSITGVNSPLSPSFPPPLITTTISVSSAKEAQNTIMPSEASTRSSDEREPRQILPNTSAQGGWVEMSPVHHPRPQ
ncbi:hypothetical protein N7468_008555 [Penicillium chermesinum]|uniref:Rhodopsin domain-containing protein n=1 Tax=Penicillium chermesinum TaxID=63820 RepID=A0A9W9TIK3_9EURO|nr:uncharacterized protein N7468_008555 [Penicillium chermesinum]KAJ5224013.1 hypothetical protein N7468_008555 [Penicillium chermesinum]KAJ6155167.1 hypothetical protein N7470_005733 [Penicillium chermesinum]